MEYVAGFMFSEDRRLVALIRKNKPEWQKGKLNGIGGKVKPNNEGYYGAMYREFKEEAGIDVVRWRMFCDLFGDWGSVRFFETTGNLKELKQMEEEEIVIIRVNDLAEYDVVLNLHWLIPLALDGKGLFARVEHQGEIG